MKQLFVKFTEKKVVHLRRSALEYITENPKLENKVKQMLLAVKEYFSSLGNSLVSPNISIEAE